MPCIVRELTDDEATILMVDSNVQREEILPSERAWAFKMKLEALNRQGKRVDLTSTPSVRQYDSGMYTTDNQGSKVGILIRRLINNRTGEKHTVFCAEHGIDFKTGVVYNGQYYTPTNSAMRKACKIAYLGWYKDQGDYVQQYIWETLGQSNATFINTENQQAYENFKANINSQLDNFAKKDQVLMQQQ